MKTKKTRERIVEPKVHVGARVDEAVYERMVRCAKKRKVKITTLLRTIIPEWLVVNGH